MPLGDVLVKFNVESMLLVKIAAYTLAHQIEGVEHAWEGCLTLGQCMANWNTVEACKRATANLQSAVEM